MTLMKYGAQVDLEDKNGRSALWLAQLNVVLTLLDKTKVSDVDWCLPVHYPPPPPPQPLRPPFI